MFAIIAVLLPLSGCGLYSAYSALSPYTSSSDDDEEQEDIHHSHSTPFTDDDTDDDQTFSPDGSSDSLSITVVRNGPGLITQAKSFPVDK